MLRQQFYNIEMKKRTVLSLLLALFILGAFFRLYHLQSVPPGLYPDEAINGNDGIAAVRSGTFPVFFPNNNGREGLFVNLVGLAVAGFGHYPWAIRLVSALFGIFTVLGTYFFSRRLFRLFPVSGNMSAERIALFAAFFLSVSFWHVNFSRIGFRAIMAPFFLVWGLFFLFKIIGREEGLSKKTSAVFSAVAGGLFFGAGIHSYIAYRIAPLLLVIPFLIGIREWRRGTKKPQPCFPCLFILFLFFALIAASPLFLYFAAHPADFFGRTTQVSVFSSPEPLITLGKNLRDTLGMFWFRGDGNWRHNIAGEPQLILPVGILFALGIIVAIKEMTRSEMHKLSEVNRRSGGLGFMSKALIFIPRILRLSVSSTYGLLFWWIVLFLLPVITSNEGIPHALRAIGIIPAVYVLSALGLDWLFAHAALRIGKITHILLFMLLAGVALGNAYRYFGQWGISPNVADAFDVPSVKAGNFLNSLPSSTEKYIIVNRGGVSVNGIPMSAQTIMFITDTATAAEQAKKHVTYVLPEQAGRIARARGPIAVVLLGDSPSLRAQIASAIPDAVVQKISQDILIAGPRNLITPEILWEKTQ